MRTSLLALLGVTLVTTFAAAPAGFASSNKGTRDIVLLTGSEVVPGPGDTDGEGAVRLYLQGSSGICVFVQTTNVAPPLTSIDLHRAGAGEAGDVVVELIGRTSDADPATCVYGVDSHLVKDIDNNPGDYYLAVHSEEFPNGALRGQLDNGTPGLRTVNARGSGVVPGPGDADGQAGILYGYNQDGRLCASQTAGNIAPPLTAVHLHQGIAGERTDDILAVVHGPSQDLNVAGCVQLSEAQIDDLDRNPGDYYFDIHTEEFPDGALRGQLR